MENIDCLMIGHNEINISRQLKLFKLNYGETSHNYRERRKFNLANIKYQGKVYSLSTALKELCSLDFSSDVVFGSGFSLAIAYLGSFLIKKGVSFDYINSFNFDKEELIRKLKEKRILTIAITTTYYLSALPISEIISLIKKYNQDIKIIVGGPFILNQVKGLDKIALESLLKSMGADVYICSSEGEATLSSVIQAFKYDKPISEIGNIYYKDSEKFVHTFNCKEENSINENKVDWSLFKDNVKNNVNIRTSISCPFSCSFCSFPISAGKYRTASLETIENELDTLYSIGKVKGFSFIDDTINFPPERFKSLLRMMIKKNYNFKWSCFFRCQHADKEMVELMKESGCVQVFCGIESGNQQILNNLNKRTIVDSYIKGFSLLNEYKITSIASVFIGFPGETYETYRDTFNLIEEVKPTFIQARLWWYDHNAPIFNEREKYKLSGNGYEWSHSSMDSKMALKLADEMVLSVKNSIHLPEYSIPFNMLMEGYPIEKIKCFINNFSNCIKEGISNSDYKETSETMIENLRNSFK